MFGLGLVVKMVKCLCCCSKTLFSGRLVFCSCSLLCHLVSTSTIQSSVLVTFIPSSSEICLGLGLNDCAVLPNRTVLVGHFSSTRPTDHQSFQRKVLKTANVFASSVPKSMRSPRDAAIFLYSSALLGAEGPAQGAWMRFGRGDERSQGQAVDR